MYASRSNEDELQSLVIMWNCGEKIGRTYKLGGMTQFYMLPVIQ